VPRISLNGQYYTGLVNVSSQFSRVSPVYIARDDDILIYTIDLKSAPAEILNIRNYFLGGYWEAGAGGCHMSFLRNKITPKSKYFSLVSDRITFQLKLKP
jgi:hypothetical protein